MKIKKIGDVRVLAELGLSPKYRKLLADYDPREIVSAARQNTLKDRIMGVGPNVAQAITDELKTAGFIDCESPVSLAHRQLLARVGLMPRDYFGSTEEYEARQELTLEQYDCVQNALVMLTPQEARVLVLRFGLQNGVALTRKQCAAQLQISENTAKTVETQALRKLKHQSRAKILREGFPELMRGKAAG